VVGEEILTDQIVIYDLPEIGFLGYDFTRKLDTKNASENRKQSKEKNGDRISQIE
jgi:hypothetical protein